MPQSNATPVATSATPPTTSASSGVLTPVQIGAYAYGAGFRGESLRIAIAVALAESDGRVKVVNSIGATGLWQIYIKAHPEYTTAQMQDPAKNAAAAFKISNSGKNWRPWTTYTSGSYKSRLGAADAAISEGSQTDEKGVPRWVRVVAPLAGPLGPVVAGTVDKVEKGESLTGIPEAIDRFRETLRIASLSYVLLIVGLVLLILGVVIILRRQAGNLAMNAIPGGSAVKTVLKAVK